MSAETFSCSSALNRFLADIHDGQRLTAIGTGFVELDECLNGGLRPGRLSIVAGATGVGSSIFALGLARHTALRCSTSAAVVSAQSAQHDLLLQVVSAETKIPLSHLRESALEPAHLDRLERFRADLVTAPLELTSFSGRTDLSRRVLARARTAVDEGARLVVVDGLSVAEPHARAFARELKEIAGADRAAVVLVANSRPTRTGATPLLEDLRDHDAIADLADLVLLLSRDDMANPASNRPGTADVEVAKHRFGPTRTIMLAFQGHYARFTDPTRTPNTCA